MTQSYGSYNSVSKRTASTWVDEETYERLTRIAKVDRRSLAEVLAMSVEHGLPLLEEELSHKLRAAAVKNSDAAVKKASPTTPVDLTGAAAAGGLEMVQKRRKRAAVRQP